MTIRRQFLLQQRGGLGGRVRHDVRQLANLRSPASAVVVCRARHIDGVGKCARGKLLGRSSVDYQEHKTVGEKSVQRTLRFVRLAHYRRGGARIIDNRQAQKSRYGAHDFCRSTGQPKTLRTTNRINDR